MSSNLNLPIYSLNLNSNDPELLTSVDRRGARVDEIDDLIDGLPVHCRTLSSSSFMASKLLIGFFFFGFFLVQS